MQQSGQEKGGYGLSDCLYKCFYSKDISKKTKSYNDGFLIIAEGKIKLFDEDGKKLINELASKIHFQDKEGAPNTFQLCGYYGN